MLDGFIGLSKLEDTEMIKNGRLRPYPEVEGSSVGRERMRFKPLLHLFPI